MKEKKIKILIVAMTIAVIGLISLQIIWSVKTINMEEDRFDALVNKALADAAFKLEKSRTANVLLDKVTKGKKQIIWVDSTSSAGDSNKIVFFGKNSSASIEHKAKGKNIEMNIEISSEHKGDLNEERIFKRIVKVDKNQNLDKNKISSKIDTISFDKGHLIKEVLEEMVSFDRDKYFTENIDSSKIDSLILNEFRNKGINTEYNFGIFNDSDGKFVFVSKYANKDELIHSKYKTLLSPHDIFTKSFLLIVEIPNRFTIILQSIWEMFFLSLLFIVIIVWVFVKTIKMFLEQKKVTEIKNDLINNITHEFKTPISTIALASEALAEPMLIEQKDSLKRYANIISEENNKLNELVENLLTSAAFEKSEIILQKLKFNIIEVIDKTISQFAERKDDVKISFEKNSNDIINANIDRFHFVNILTNLLDNAYKYSPKIKEIIIEIREVENGIQISVTDKGIGISKTNQQKIFDTFYRVQTGNIQDVRGYGIGLSYVKKIIEAHNGKIEVLSKLGFGTTFKIFLPNE